MSYKRTVKKDGKSYGPYIYESYRDENGVVKKRYLGKVDDKRSKKVFLPVLLTISFLVLVFASVSFENPFRDFVEQQTGLDFSNVLTGHVVDEGSSDSGDTSVSSSSDSSSSDSSTSTSDSSSADTSSSDSSSVSGDSSSESSDVISSDSSGTDSVETTVSEDSSESVVDSTEQVSDNSPDEVSSEQEVVVDEEPVIENPVDNTEETLTDDSSSNEENVSEQITPIVEPNETVSEETNESVDTSEQNQTTSENETIVENKTTIVNETIPDNEGGSGGVPVSNLTIVNETNVSDLTNETVVNQTIVNETIQNQTTIVDVNVSTNESVIIDATNLEVVQYDAVIGRPVRWLVIANSSSFENESEIFLDLPENAENISVLQGQEVENALKDKEKYKDLVKESSGEQITTGLLTGNVVLDLESGKSFFEKLVDWFSRLFSATGNVVLEDELQQEELIVKENGKTKVNLTKYKDKKDSLAITYYTPAPTSIEKEVDGDKVIVISSDEEGYENVLAYTEIDDSLKVTDKSEIRLIWYENQDVISESSFSDGEIVNDFSTEDRSGDGYIDYIEWNVPHLSNQSYKIIILVSEAYWLDENKTVIEDVYDSVGELDGVYQAIPEGNYLRVTFETELDSSRDITIYADADENVSVEVYTVNGSEPVIVFENISNYTGNKEFLTNLPYFETADTFDLLSVGGDVSYDFVIDPTCTTTSECNPDNCLYNSALDSFECDSQECQLGESGVDDWTCPATEECNGGICEVIPCTVDANCSTGEYCNVSSGVCLAVPSICTNNGDCPSTFFCNESAKCQADLGTGSSCNSSVVYDNSATPSNEACISGYCRDDYGAYSDEDGLCDLGEECYCASSSTTCVHDGSGTISSSSTASECYNDSSTWLCTNGDWNISFCSGYLCSSGTCGTSCTWNANCSDSFYCYLADVQDPTGTCEAELSNGVSCLSVSFQSKKNENYTEDDGACSSGFCDNDGLGLTDDGLCYSPTNFYFDSNDGLCEYDIGNLTSSTVDERANDSCVGSSGYINGTCSYFTDGDSNSETCTCILGAGYWNLGGEVSNTTCCGDDASEYSILEIFNTTTMDGSAGSTDACCDTSTDCVDDGSCYTGVSHDADADGDADACFSGTWQDCSTNAQCPSIGYYCINNDCDNYCTSNDNCSQASGGATVCNLTSNKCIVPIGNGGVCTVADECESLLCYDDYDGGKFCANTSSTCVHDGLTFADTYFAPDCNNTGTNNDDGIRWICDSGNWNNTNASGAYCSGGEYCVDGSGAVGATCESCTTSECSTYKSCRDEVSNACCDFDSECNATSPYCLSDICFASECTSSDTSNCQPNEGCYNGNCSAPAGWTDYGTALSGTYCTGTFDNHTHAFDPANFSEGRCTNGDVDLLDYGYFAGPYYLECDLLFSGTNISEHFHNLADVCGVEIITSDDAEQMGYPYETYDGNTPLHIHPLYGIFDGDTSSTCCVDCKGANAWNIGGVSGSQCCGDDAGEYKKTTTFDSGMDAAADLTYSCCDQNSDCHDNDGCYNNATVSRDADSDGDNDYCLSSTWYDCLNDSQCSSGYECSASNDCIISTPWVESVIPKTGDALNSGNGRLNITVDGVLAEAGYVYNILGVGNALDIKQTSTTYLHTGLNDNSRYCYNVSIYNQTASQKVSNYSDAVCNITLDRTAPATQIVNLTSNSTSINLETSEGENGLILYMPFEEGSGSITDDWSSSNNDGTLYNWQGPAFSTGKTGNGNAIDFYGQDSTYIEGANDYDGTAFTISGWVKYSNSQTTPGFVSITDSSGKRKDVYIYGNNKIRVFYDTGSNNYYGVTSTFDALNDNEWHFIAGTSDGTNIYAYVDGIRYTVSGAANQSTYPASKTRIGALNIGTMTAAYYFTGQIDEVRIYNRSLSQQEIINDMQSGLIKKNISKSDSPPGGDPFVLIASDIADDDYVDTDIVDGGLPNTVSNLSSTSHSLNLWSSDMTVDFNWTVATDTGTTYYYYTNAFDSEGNNQTSSYYNETYVSGVANYSFHSSCVSTASLKGTDTSETFTFTNNGSNTIYLKTKDVAGNWGSSCANLGSFLLCSNTLVDADADDVNGTVNLTDTDNHCGCSGDDSNSCDTNVDGTKDGVCCGSGCVGNINSECCTDSDCSGGDFCNESYMCESVPNPSLYRFELEDSIGNKIVYIDDKGDMYLGGNLFTGQTISSIPQNSFVIQDSSGSTIGYFTDAGSLYLAGNIELSVSNFSSGDSKLEFQNATGSVVAYIDESGNMKLKGGYALSYTGF